MSSTISEKEATPVSIDNTPATDQATAQAQTNEAPQAEHNWREEVEMAGSQLVERVKELIAEGNVRRLIIRNAEDKILLEIPLTTGVAVGGVVTLLSPVIAALGALAALIAHFKVQVIREEPK